MKTRLLLVAFILVGIIGYSQDSALGMKLTKSEIFKDKKKHTSLTYSISDDEGGIILIRSVYSGFMIKKVKNYYLEHFDKDLKLISSHTYALDNNSISGAYVKEGKLHLIERFWNKKAKKIELNVKYADIDSYDFKTTNLIRIDEEQMNTQRVFLYGIGLGKADGNLLGEIIISENKKYIAFSIDGNDKDKETHKYYLFDTAFNKVFETNFERDIKDRKYTYLGFEIDEKNARIYMLGKVFTKAKKKKKEGGKYGYEINRISASGFKTLKFDSGEHYIGSLYIANGEVLKCVGFYSDEKDWRYKGVVQFNINEDLSKASAQYSPFTEQFIADKYGKRKDKELRNIDLRDIVMYDTGEIFLNAEESYVTTNTSMDMNGNWRTTYTYHFNDIIIAKLNNEGKLEWARNINKRQTSSGVASPFVSYTSSSKNQKNYFFINCSDKIRKIKNDRIEFRGAKAKKSNLYVISVDSNGNFESKKLLDDKNNEVPFFIGRGIVDDVNEEILFTGRKKSKKQILKISY